MVLLLWWWIGRGAARAVAFVLFWLLLFRHLFELLFILLLVLGSSRHLTFAVRISKCRHGDDLFTVLIWRPRAP